MQRTGTLFILASAAGFGAMAIFGKLAYEQGATVGTTLAARFTLAALLFWVLIGGPRALRGIPRRDLLLGLALGAVGYALQAGAYFAALDRIDASLLSLLLYTFPVMVAVGAVALGRERLDARRALALGLAVGGGVLIVGNTGELEPLGAALGLLAAATYSVYILTSQGISGRLEPRRLATLVCTGAAVSLTLATAATGELAPGAVSAAGWGWLLALSAVSTVAAIACFFAGLRRVGPTAAAILSTAEPLVTLWLAFAVFGERLGAVQLVGGALVVAAVPVLHLRRRRATMDSRGGALRYLPALRRAG